MFQPTRSFVVTLHAFLQSVCFFKINPFPSIHDIPLLLMYFGGLYCKQYGPRSDCSLRSSLIWVHNVCFSEKMCLECIWIHVHCICSRHIKQGSMTFGQNHFVETTFGRMRHLVDRTWHRLRRLVDYDNWSKLRRITSKFSQNLVEN